MDSHGRSAEPKVGKTGMKTIVALVDFSDVAANIIKQVQILAQAFQSQVTVLHGILAKPVVVDAGVFPQEPTAAEIQEDLTRLEKLTEPLRTCGIAVNLKQIRVATL